MKTAPQIPCGSLVFFCAAILLPGSAAAQQQPISVSPTSVSVQATVGTDAPSQFLQVKKRGKATTQVTWSVLAPSGGWPSWLKVLPLNGTNDGTLTLTFTTSALAVNTYQTSFSVQATGSSPITVNVQATIVSSAPPPPPPPPTGGTLYVTCPANRTVASPNGSAVAVTYSATTEGGVAPVTVTYYPASGSLFPVGTTTVNVNARSSDGQSSWCSFTVTVNDSTPTPPSQLVANCPANVTASSANGGPVPVTYNIPTPSGGTLPYTTISGSPASGSNFPVGTTTVTVTVQDSSQPQQTDTCTFTVTVTDNSSPPPPPPPPSTGVGPQSSISCPATRVDIFPTDTVGVIQSLVNANPGATTFCFHAGTYQINGSITPKTGNTFVGEFGAILDGTGWTTTDDTQAPFRVYDDPNDPNDPNTAIDNVTIRNLVIRDMPQYGIHGSHTRSANNWTIANNEVAFGKFGVMFTSNSHILNNYIHDNVGDPTSPTPGLRGGGYVGQYAHNTTVDSNEIARNGPEQKVGLSLNVRFTNNFVHHNLRDGIWFDLNNNDRTVPLAAIIQGNRIEDNRGNGIVFEISIGADIANNTFLRNGEDAVLITVSQNANIHDNVLDGNFGGIEYFLNCGSFSEGFDLRNNAAYDNTVTITTAVAQNFGYLNGFSHLSQCTSTQLAPYLNGDKNLTFSRNTYHVPALSYTRYFLWSGWKDWTQWRALIPTQSLQDPGGSIISP